MGSSEDRNCCLVQDRLVLVPWTTGRFGWRKRGVFEKRSVTGKGWVKEWIFGNCRLCTASWLLAWNMELWNLRNGHGNVRKKK